MVDHTKSIGHDKAAWVGYAQKPAAAVEELATAITWAAALAKPLDI